MQQGLTLWFTGLPGSGKTTVSRLVCEQLRQFGSRVELLDGDVMRTQLCKGLGFTREDRRENVLRVGFVCELLSRNGVVAIAALVSPYREDRDQVRCRIERFVEIYMSCPLPVLLERDTKGMYRKALAGEIPQFTGVSDPYEAPSAPDLTIDSSRETPMQSAEKVIRHLWETEALPELFRRYRPLRPCDA